MNLICVPTAKTSLHFALWTLSNDYLGKYSFKILESNTFGLESEFEIWKLSAKDRGATENPVSNFELNLSKTATKAIEF